MHLQALEARRMFAADIGNELHTPVSDVVAKAISNLPDSNIQVGLESQLAGAAPASINPYKGANEDLLSQLQGGEIPKASTIADTVNVDGALNLFQERLGTATNSSHSDAASGVSVLLQTQSLSEAFIPFSMQGTVTPASLPATDPGGFASSLMQLFTGTDLVEVDQGPDSISFGWACDVMGNQIFIGNRVNTQTDGLVGEGEDLPPPPGDGSNPGGDGGGSGGDNGGGGDSGGDSEPYVLPAALPEIVAPSLQFPSFVGSYDNFVPFFPSSYHDEDSFGTYTASTTVPDSSMPGTHWIHIVDQTYTSESQWSYSESLVMSFNESNTGTDENGGGTTMSKVGGISVSFTASQGITTPSNAGVAWSLSINFSETAGMAFSTSGGSTANQGNLTTNAATVMTAGPTGDGSDAWDGSGLTSDYNGTSSWSSNASASVFVSGNYVLSSTPAMVAGEVERDFSANGGVDRGMDVQLGGSWSAASSSGSLFVDASTVSPHTSWPSSSTVPAGGDLDVDLSAAGNAMSSGTGFEPLPDFEGSGHASAASGGINTHVGSGGGVDFNITGTIRNGQLQSIAGDLVSGLQEQIGDDFHENRVYVFQNDVQDTAGDTSTELHSKIGYGWNLSPSVSATLNSEHKIGLSASPEGNLITTTIHDFVETDAAGSTNDLDFIELTVSLTETVDQGPNFTSTLSGGVDISNVFVSQSSGEIDVDSSLANPFDGEASVQWRDNGHSIQIEFYDTEWTRINDSTDEEFEPVYQFQYEDELLANVLTVKRESTGDISLIMASDGSTTQTGTANSDWEDAIDSTYDVTHDNYIIYYEPFDFSSYMMFANEGTITETFQQTASGGMDFDSAATPVFTEHPATITGDVEPQVSGSLEHTSSSSYNPSGSTNSNSNDQDLLDYLANGINSLPVVGDITGLTNQVLAPMVQNTVGDEFLMETSGEALVGFTVGAAALTVLTGGAGASAGTAIAGCSTTGVIIGGAMGGAGEYLAISGLANGINPAANDPTIEGTVMSAATGAVGGLAGKWLGLLGCFVEGTEVTLSGIPRNAAFESALWSNEFDDLTCAASVDYLNEPGSMLATAASPLSASSSGLKSPASRLHISIENVPLGSLVPSKNPKPWEYDDSLPEPDESTWLQVSMTLERSDGATVDVELLRPASWVHEQSLLAGSRLPIQIPELEVSGFATVHSVATCPRLAIGDGSFVTGRFVTRRVEQTVELELEDGSTVEGTAIHPVWSLDRNDWVPLGELETGELLQAEHGPVAVNSLRILDRPTAVYNIEVHGQHVFQVGELGLLVHNACSNNSRTLGRNLAAGDSTTAAAIRKQGYSAGHVVPAVGFSRRAQAVVDACNDARATLSNVGIDVNDAANGFWTNNSKHLGSHRDKYLLDMGDKLKDLNDKGLVQDVLEELREALFAGEYL